MKTPRRITSPVVLATILAAGLGTTRAVFAQNALGDGTALDANLQTGSGGVNPLGRDFAAEARFRNAIVTGNVPGGFAFRGDIGYTAGNDFRGSLGSDDLFELRRDSFYSGLGTRGISGIAALQATLAYTVSGQTNGLLGGLIVNSPGSGASAADFGADARNTTPTVDIFGNIRGNLRAPSGTTLTTLDRPDYLSALTDSAGNTSAYVAASDLTGIRPISAASPIVGGGDPEFEALQLERLRSGLPLQSPLDAEADEEQAPPRTYDAILRELGFDGAGNRAADGPQGVPRPDAEPGGPGVPGVPDPTTTDDPDDEGDEGATDVAPDPLASLREALRRAREPVVADPLESLRRGAAPDPDAEDEADRPETTLERVERAIEETEEFLGRSVGVDAFVGTTDHPDYRRHLAAGERLLAEGQWFRAEERFTAALTVVKGDPVAALGRMHAQLGAGMYLSAGTNLRSLFEAYPEMMTARLDAKYLPKGERLETIREQLRFRIERPTVLSSQAAALLAYLGVQTGNAEDVELGLAEYRAMTTDPETGEPDPLALVLEAAWSARTDGGERAP